MLIKPSVVQVTKVKCYFHKFKENTLIKNKNSQSSQIAVYTVLPRTRLTER